MKQNFKQIKQLTKQINNTNNLYTLLQLNRELEILLNKTLDKLEQKRLKG